LAKVKDNVETFGKDFEYNLKMQQIDSQMRTIDERAKRLVREKRETTLTSGTVVNNILVELKQQSYKNAKSGNSKQDIIDFQNLMGKKIV